MPTPATGAMASGAGGAGAGAAGAGSAMPDQLGGAMPGWGANISQGAGPNQNQLQQALAGMQLFQQMRQNAQPQSSGSQAPSTAQQAGQTGGGGYLTQGQGGVIPGLNNLFSMLHTLKVPGPWTRQ